MEPKEIVTYRCECGNVIATQNNIPLECPRCGKKMQQHIFVQFDTPHANIKLLLSPESSR